MSNIAKLKKKAAEFELKKQPDKALAVYVDLIAEYESSPEELDVTLFNRVGDLLLRQGNVADAVDYYERAVDHYGEGGFFNNAIALCNKILRQSPGRTSIYYKLGKISAQKGFTAEAKRNFLEFADRMQKSGRLDEAFRALKEFADLCPDQDDIRLMLADQLQKAGKPGQAVEQLQLLYQRYTAENRSAEAEATAERIRSIDPDAEVRASDAPLETKAQDLVFLDLNEAPRLPRGSTPRPTGIQPAPHAPPPSDVEPVIERTAVGDGVLPEEIDAAPLEGVTRSAEVEADALVSADAPPIDGLVATSFDAPEALDVPTSLLDLEQTVLPGAEEVAADRTPDGAAVAPADPMVAPEADDEPALMLSDDAFTVPVDDGPSMASPTHGLPLMDLEADARARQPDATEEAENAGAHETALGRASTMLAARSVEMLQAVVDANPVDWSAHRELGEAMFEAGNRDGGLLEFEAAMKGYEADGNLEAAAS
ncbi:MAG: tetratricopeptide repeat protein, partial [Gemmatimonadaceae bacterium]